MAKYDQNTATEMDPLLQFENIPKPPDPYGNLWKRESAPPDSSPTKKADPTPVQPSSDQQDSLKLTPESEDAEKNKIELELLLKQMDNDDAQPTPIATEPSQTFDDQQQEFTTADVDGFI